LTDTTFTFKISVSSSAPSGVTYYLRLGSFYNDASGNITLVSNDNDYYGSSFGTWEGKSSNVTYLASTDGIVCAFAGDAGGGPNDLRGWSDSGTSPSTLRTIAYVDVAEAGPNYQNITFPVKKGNYWKVTQGFSVTTVVYWLPAQS
jgi:hypothetical protein